MLDADAGLGQQAGQFAHGFNQGIGNFRIAGQIGAGRDIDGNCRQSFSATASIPDRSFWSGWLTLISPSALKYCFLADVVGQGLAGLFDNAVKLV